MVQFFVSHCILELEISDSYFIPTTAGISVYSLPIDSFLQNAGNTEVIIAAVKQYILLE